MAYNIRPLSFAEVLDRAFQVLRDNFWLVVGITAAAFIPYGVILAFARTIHQRGIEVVGLLLFMVAAPVMSAALAVAVANVYLDRPTTVGKAYTSTRPIIFELIGTWLLFYVLILLAYLALIIPGIYFTNCWALLMPIMIVEGRFGMGALRRSRALVKGSWWRTFGLMVVAGLIATVPASALEILWSFIPFFGPILTTATQAVTSSYSMIVIVIYYFDRRCRTEDFDLRLLAQQVREAGAAAVPGASSVA